MPQNLERRFTLIDGMILIAATATGLAVARASNQFPHWDRGLLGRGDPASIVREGSIRLAFATGLASNWAIGLLVVRLRWPRPRWRRLARQPGFLACVIVASSCVWEALTVLVIQFSRCVYLSKFAGRDWLAGLLSIADNLGSVFTVPNSFGFPILAAWLAQTMAGVRRPDPGWIDRLGRGIGWFCILTNVAWFVINYL